MSIKIKKGEEDLHTNDIMSEDTQSASAIDTFWGISGKKDKQQPKKEETAAGKTTVSEKNNITINDVIYSKKSEKNQEKTEEFLKEVWQEFTAEATEIFPECKIYTDVAELVEITPAGIAKIVVPTSFAKEMIGKRHAKAFSLLQRHHGIKGYEIYEIGEFTGDGDDDYFVKCSKKLLKDRKLSNADLRVYLILLSYRNNKSKVCAVGVRKIMSDYGISGYTIQASIKNLIATGYVEKYTDGSKQAGSVYYLFPLLD